MPRFTRELLEAIAKWPIDAGEGAVPSPHFMAESDIDRFLEERRSFVIGKKGTGKTALARRMASGPDSKVVRVSFADVIEVYGSLVQHQVKAGDTATARLAFRVAGAIVGLRAFGEKVSAPSISAQADKAAARLTRDRLFPKLVNSLSRVAVKTSTEENAPNFEVSHRSSLDVRHNASELKDTLDQLDTCCAELGHLTVLVDGMDDHDDFRVTPFKPAAEDILRTAILSIFDWRQNAKRKVDLVLLLRPEFLDVAGVYSSKQRILDVSWRLEWGKEQLLDMLSYRVNQELQRIISGVNRDIYSGKSGSRAAFGRSEPEYQECMDKLFDSSFYRPRDLIHFAKVAATRALSDDPGLEVSATQLDRVRESQRLYLVDEIAAELAITLPQHEKFVACLRNIQASDRKIFLVRSEFDHRIKETISHEGLEVDARGATQRLYSAFAIGYRGPNADRQFAYLPGGNYLLNDVNMITLHDAFSQGVS